MQFQLEDRASQDRPTQDRSIQERSSQDRAIKEGHVKVGQDNQNGSILDSSSQVYLVLELGPTQSYLFKILCVESGP